MKKIVNIALAGILILSCNNKSNVVESKGLSVGKKVEVLESFIKVKSKVKDAEFKFYDVNRNNRSIPGPSDKDYKAIIYLNPNEVALWTAGKSKQEDISHSGFEWLSDLVSQDQFKSI